MRIIRKEKPFEIETKGFKTSQLIATVKQTILQDKQRKREKNDAKTQSLLVFLDWKSIFKYNRLDRKIIRILSFMTESSLLKRPPRLFPLSSFYYFYGRLYILFIVNRLFYRFGEAL